MEESGRNRFYIAILVLPEPIKIPERTERAIDLRDSVRVEVDLVSFYLCFSKSTTGSVPLTLWVHRDMSARLPPDHFLEQGS